MPSAASALLLSACTTVVGPTVPVQPVADRRMDSTAAIQGMFNAAYGGCMATRSNVVLTAAPAGMPAGSGTAVSDQSDPDSLAARRSLAAVIDGFRRDCDGERIAVAVTGAAVSPAVEARMVELTTPGGGSCFGQPGKNAYLLAKAGAGCSARSPEPSPCSAPGTTAPPIWS